MIEFKLENAEFIELVQLLKYLKIAMSGGEAKIMIAKGQVLRNGEVETRKRAKIRPGESIEIQGEVINIV